VEEEADEDVDESGEDEEDEEDAPTELRRSKRIRH